MRCRYTRRSFVKGAVAAGAAAALAIEERALLGKPAKGAPKADAKNSLPKGKIGDLEISRLIMGGNLLAGFAHSRDLVYVSQLVKQYHTEEKIFETLQLGEANGINAINTNPRATEAIGNYRRKFRTDLVWIVQGYPGKAGDLTDIRKSAAAGADAIYIQGNIADRFVAAGNLKVLGKAIDLIKALGLPAGVGGHSIEVAKACEKADLGADFYVKTLHTSDYWSARQPDQKGSVVDSRTDNYWCTDPKGTIEFMQTVKKPWIAYKVMAAGAIHPRKAFPYVYQSGADFILAGMFDFQVAQDARIARKALAGLKRKRPWRG